MLRLYAYETVTLLDLREEFKIEAERDPELSADPRCSSQDEVAMRVVLREAGIRIMRDPLRRLHIQALADVHLLSEQEKGVRSGTESTEKARKAENSRTDKSVGLAIRAELKKFASDTMVPRKRAGEFDASGQICSDEIAFAEKKCPRAFGVLRNITRAMQTFVPCEQPRSIPLRGTAAGASAEQRSMGGIKATKPTLDQPVIEKKLLRAYSAFSILLNTINNECYHPLQLNSANVLFSELKKTSWAYLNALGVTPSYDTFVRRISDLVAKGLLAFPKDTEKGPVLATIDNLDWSGAKAWFQSAMMHLITGCYIMLPAWRDRDAPQDLDSQCATHRTLWLPESAQLSERETAYAKLVARPAHRLENVAQKLWLACADDTPPLFDELAAGVFPVTDGAVLDAFDKIYPAPQAGSISNDIDFCKYLNQIAVELGAGKPGWRRCVVIAGDQETYEMMKKMKRLHGTKYDWVLPWPGDLHISMNFAKTVINHNSFRFTLEHLGKAYGFEPGNLRALETASRYQSTKEFLIAVYIASLRDLRRAYEVWRGKQVGHSVLKRADQLSQTELTEWVGKVAHNDEVFRMHVDLILRDVQTFVFHHMSIRCADFELRRECLVKMLPLFAGHQHTRYVKLILDHLTDMDTMPPAYLSFMHDAFALSRTGAQYKNQAPDEVHESCPNRDLKVALRRLVAGGDGKWLKIMCQYSAVAVQQQVLHLEQTLQRRDSNTAVAAPRLDRAKNNQRREKTARIQEELQKVQALTPVEERKCVSPWKPAICAVGAEVTRQVLSAFEAGEGRSKEFAIDKHFGGKTAKVSWKPPPKLGPKKLGVSQLRKQASDGKARMKCLMKRLVGAAKANGTLSLQQLTEDLQFCAYPLAFCNDKGVQHKSNKANMNACLADVLSGNEFDEVQSSQLPRDTLYVVSLDILLELYSNIPSQSTLTWDDWRETFIDRHINSCLGQPDCRAVLIIADKAQYVPKTKGQEQRRRRANTPSSTAASTSSVDPEEQHDKPLPRKELDKNWWAKLCGNAEVRSKMLQFLCDGVVQAVMDSDVPVFLDGHCGCIVDGTRAPLNTPVRVQNQEASLAERLSNEMGEADVGVLHLAAVVATSQRSHRTSCGFAASASSASIFRCAARVQFVGVAAAAGGAAGGEGLNGLVCPGVAVHDLHVIEHDGHKHSVSTWSTFLPHLLSVAGGAPAAPRLTRPHAVAGVCAGVPALALFVRKGAYACVVGCLCDLRRPWAGRSAHCRGC